MEAFSRCLDRYMLLHLTPLGPAETLAQIGDYFLATRIAKPLALLGALLSAIVLPHAVHLWEARNEREAAQIISRATPPLPGSAKSSTVWTEKFPLFDLADPGIGGVADRITNRAQHSSGIAAAAVG